MGVVIFDPCCFVDEVIESSNDPRYPENKLIMIDMISKVRLYQEVVQSLHSANDILARPVDANSYISTEDDIYTVVDNICDNLVKILDFDHLLVISENYVENNSVQTIIDEYESFYQCGAEYGEEPIDKDGFGSEVFADYDEAIEILRNILTTALEYSIINYTGKRNLITKTKLL